MTEITFPVADTDPAFTMTQEECDAAADALYAEYLAERDLPLPEGL
jgi:hypothetical protein